MRTPLHPIANPGASATVDLYAQEAIEIGSAQYPVKEQPTQAHTYRLILNADQIVNIRQLWQAPGDTDFRPVGSDVPTVANTVKTYEAKLWPGRNVFRVITTTGPTVWEMAHELSDEPV